MFASKPQLAGDLLDRAHRLGIRLGYRWKMSTIAARVIATKAAIMVRQKPQIQPLTRLRSFRDDFYHQVGICWYAELWPAGLRAQTGRFTHYRG
jgi:hypothetical protein